VSHATLCVVTAALERWKSFCTTAVYLAVGALTVAGALAFARTRYAWLASALSVVLVGPRLFIYDVTYFLVGADRGKVRAGREGA
jgi:hypothetical protein